VPAVHVAAQVEVRGILLHRGLVVAPKLVTEALTEELLDFRRCRAACARSLRRPDKLLGVVAEPVRILAWRKIEQPPVRFGQALNFLSADALVLESEIG
jgi:hypothetical protein